MEPVRRRALLVGAWLATAIASGAFVAWALRSGTPERVSVEGAGPGDPAPPPSLAPDPRGLPTRAVAPAGPAPAAPKTPSNGPDAGIGGADADPEAPSLAVAWIEVTAVAGPGPAGPVGTAYAFPHDAPPVGAGDEDPWPRVNLDGEGHGRIPLPAAGRWDVGVVTPAAWGILRDVNVQASGTSAVTVRLSATAELEVEVPETGGRTMQIFAVRVVETPGARELPTREAEWASGGTNVPTRGPGIVRLQMPAAVSLRVVGSMTDGPQETHVHLGSDPAQVTAPARVRLVATPPAPTGTIFVSARVRYSTPPPTPRRLAVVFDARGADGGETTSATSDSEALVPGERESWVSAQLSTPSHALRVSWRGTGVLPGEVMVPAAVGTERRHIEVDVEVDPGACPDLLERIAFLGGRSVAARDGERPSVWVWGPWGIEALSVEEDGRVSGSSATRIVEPRLAVATDGPWWASEAVALPSSGTARIPLSPAGYLHLVPELPLEPSMGTPQLHRADGAPLTSIEEAVGRESAEAFNGEVKPGVLLGPLPRGEIELVLKLGGVERRRIRATVRAGRITALPLAW